ncbi:hypothetical protein FQZ97_903130 [compost metagenome]
MPGVIILQLALEREQHVVCVEVAGRGEIFGGVELDALTQVEGVFQAVVGHVIALGQAGLGGRGALGELHQAVVDRTAGGVEGGAGGIGRRVEAFGRAFRAIDKGLGLRCTSGQGQHGGRRHEGFHQFHDLCLPRHFFAHPACLPRLGCYQSLEIEGAQWGELTIWSII